MHSNTDFNAIAELDLEAIKVKLMHEASGEGWTLERANTIEAEYRRFLILMKKYPNEQTAPLVDIDTFWHYHILDTLKYAADCEAVFGYFLHHFPYIGLRGEADAAAHERLGQRMKELYQTTFGEEYGVSAAAFSGAAAQSAYSGMAAANTTAFSGVASAQAGAFSGAVASVQSAFSGAASARAAFSGMATPNAFYAERPRQATTA
jgi:hypothetical protein